MTLRECRQPRICPWKLINFNQSFDEVINNCCRDKMFLNGNLTIHFLVARKRKNIFVARKGGRIRITFIVFSFPWVTFYFLVCGTALNSSSRAPPASSFVCFILDLRPKISIAPEHIMIATTLSWLFKELGSTPSLGTQVQKK